MPHILSMPIAYQEKLNRANVARIKPQVRFYMQGFAVTSVVGGSLTYDINDTEQHCFDISDSIKNEKIVIQKSIPELPTFTGSGSITQYSNVKLQVQKTKGDFLQYIGQGAGIKTLLGNRFEISVKVEDMPDMMVFNGTIKTPPIEDFDTVTFDVRSSMWDLVSKELKTNQCDTEAFSVAGSGLTTEIKNSYNGITTPLQRLTYHHPIITFNELGNAATIVKASDSSTADLLRVELRNDVSCSLGKYSIKWLNASSFEFTTPTAGTTVLTHAPITAATTTLYVTVPALLQAKCGVSLLELYIKNPNAPTAFNEISGKTIDFWLSFTVDGNPISIALDLTIRTITGNWNQSAALTLDPNLPINYDKFQEMESLFNFSTVYVSEWNESNSPFSFTGEEKPLQAKNIIQKILGHIGCQLTYDVDGKISISSNWYLTGVQELWRLGSIHSGVKGTGFVPSHSIRSEKEYKRMELRYGYNGMTKNTAGIIEKYSPDALVGIYGTNDKPQTYQITMPYYKAVVSDIIVNSIADYLWKWLQVQHIRLSATILPQFGLSLDVGDKFMADFTTSPILPNTDKGIGKYFMIYSLNKSLGGNVEIEAIATPEPIYPSKWCEAYWCMGGRWK